ncbi:MAG: glycine zipper 2TM domain-containing protein, partial [Pseudomonadota bacterium]
MIRKASLLLATLLTGSTALASGDHYLEVPVLDVRPEYRVERTPIEREVCWEEDHYERIDRGRRSRTSTIFGAIIGGVIGNQFGSGSGRRAATVAGAALGGSIGRDIERQNRAPDGYRLVTREQCRIERDFEEASVPAGYRVTYEYDGRLYHTRTRHHPG